MGEFAVGLLIFLGLSTLFCLAVWLMFGNGAVTLRALGAVVIMALVVGIWGWLAVGGICEVDWLLFKDSTCS